MKNLSKKPINLQRRIEMSNHKTYIEELKASDAKLKLELEEGEAMNNYINKCKANGTNLFKAVIKLIKMLWATRNTKKGGKR